MTDRKKLHICIRANDTAPSMKTLDLLKEKLTASNIGFSDNLTPATDMIISIGGDGATLDVIHDFNFTHIPIVGINTGHLGFFQEIHPEELDGFIAHINTGDYRIQELITVQATITLADGTTYTLDGLNEIVIRGSHCYTSHFNISIAGSFIEKFSGDGILVASPAGSTAYNYSVGGSIVDPRIKLLQVTPIAPMNTTAYRSFTSSILLPSDLSLGVVPEYTKEHVTYIINDGRESVFHDVADISIGFSDKVVRLVRLSSYDFWNKVKEKFL